MSTTFGSASAIVGVKVTGHSVYCIDSYSRTKDLPKGSYISIFVVLGASVDEPVRAMHRLSLLDRTGKPVPAYSKCIDLTRYSIVGYGSGIANFIKRDLLESLIGDCFKIKCDVSVLTSRTEDMAPPLSDLQRHLGDLLMAQQGADTTFLVGDETFRAHRCILSARSPFFKAKLFTREDGTFAAAEHCIRIYNVEAEVFKALLHFVYTDSLPPEIMTEREDARRMANYKALLAVADNYDVQGLKLLCAGKLIRDVNVNTAAELLALAVRHRCHLLKEACTRVPSISSRVGDGRREQ
ncbi:hypothetical protein PR202_ga15914 [Eleusine coracana subsp. coracana]|uniref:BTB domain-containing protein n=1 Tax=Eleusine coracana subsp. coracana TaxID=191504 RepID=A0AAV5CLG3_ELECO|nr:hypothetical protein QOZ80_6BG0487700 [Eleusine coracana subsp. coracana]GJM98867.1 hypothetical protein PR202_ga15914 [Eleusine coracana subsp. coracana]